MNTKLRLSFLALLVASLALPLQAINYTWNPGNVTSGDMGGDGTWSADSYWWNGSANIQSGNSTLGTQFGNNSGTTENAFLNFYGNGTINLTGTAQFETTNAATFPVHTMNFTADSNYTIQSNGAQGVIGSRSAFGYYSIMRYNVAPTAVVNFGGGGNYTQLYSYSTTGTQGTIFYGGGTINLNDKAVVRNAYEATRLTILNGTNVNFNTGSLFISDASGAVLSNPSQYSRISLESGTLTIDGGTLYTGYRGSSQTNDARSGISIGNTTSAGSVAILNLKSGTLVALGDPRDAAQARSGGINIGGTSVNNVGGTFNMTGGELITSGIRAHGQMAVVNLDGGVIQVSTDVPSTDTAVTNEDLQTRLDYFLDGFTTTTRRVHLGETGATIDTSSIDTSKTNGIATINSTLRDIDGVNGTLTKIGVNSLLLNGTNTYTGNTNVNGGNLILGSSSNLTSSARINIASGAVLDVSAYASGYAVTNATQVIAGDGTIKGDVVASAGIFTPEGMLTIDGDFVANAGTKFSFDNLADDVIKATGTLSLDSGIEIDLSGATLSTGSYTIFSTDTTGGLSGSLSAANFTGYNDSLWELSDFTNDGMNFSFSVTAIPEPSTYALIIALGMVALLIRYRRNRS